MLWPALVCFCFLLSSIDTRHIAVEPVTCREPSDDDVTMVQTADLPKNAAEGNAQRMPVEVKQPDPRHTLEFGGDRESNEAETVIKTKSKVVMEAKTEEKTDATMKARSRCKEEKEIGTRVKIEVKAQTKLEKKGKAERKTGVEVQLRLKVDGKVKVNVAMDLKSKVEKETVPVPVLKTRGFHQSLTNAFKRTTSSLPRPGGVLDLGIRTIQPFVEWTKTMCKSLPVDYNTLTSTYRRLTSRGGGSEVRDVSFKNGKTLSPDLSLETPVKDLEISSGGHEDGSDVLADFEVVDAKTPPPSPPKSNGRNGSGNQHRYRKGNGIKNGSEVGAPKTPPQSPPKPSWHDPPSKSTGKQEDTASDSDVEETPMIRSKGVGDRQGQGARGRTSPSMVKGRKSPPQGDTEIDRHALQEPSKWDKEGSKDQQSTGNQEGKPESGPTLEEIIKAQRSAFERMASIEQSVKAVKEIGGRNRNGNQNQIGKVNGVKNGNGVGAPKTPPPSPPKSPPPSPPKTPPPSPPKSPKKSPKQSPKKSPKQSPQKSPLKERKVANGGAVDDRSSLPKSTSFIPRLGSWHNPPSTSRGKKEDTALEPIFEEAPKKPSKKVGYRHGQGARSKVSSSTVERNWWDLSPMPSDEQEDTSSGSDSDVDGAPKKPQSGVGYRQGPGARGKASSSTVKGKKPSPWDNSYIDEYTPQELPMWAKKGSKDLQMTGDMGGTPESGLTLEEIAKKQSAAFERMASIARGASATIPMSSSRLRRDQFHDPAAWRNLDNKYGQQKTNDK